ncbi:MAG: hypothetical protein RI947_334 [Candidatus Parcubacteria bacterium]|jgi:large subunit ribosomal protein L3
MTGFILATKSKQSQMFDDKGIRIPTTYLLTSPCYLIDIKMPENDGYFAVKLGFGITKNARKSVQGQILKAGIETPLRFLREIRLDGYEVQTIEEEGKKGISINESKIFIGDEIKPSQIFKPGELVDVSGTSKGKGFQGVVKRHNFRGGPKTHGQSDRLRAPGSMGQTTTPGRIYKGKRMAGRMGNDRVTIQNLPIVQVDDTGMLVKGLVPGATTGLLEVKNHKK